MQSDYGNNEILKPNGKILNVWIGPGLPSTTSKLIIKIKTVLLLILHMIHKEDYFTFK